MLSSISGFNTLDTSWNTSNSEVNTLDTVFTSNISGSSTLDTARTRIISGTDTIDTACTRSISGYRYILWNTAALRVFRGSMLGILSVYLKYNIGILYCSYLEYSEYLGLSYCEYFNTRSISGFHIPRCE